MKPAIEGLTSPYLDEEIELGVPHAEETPSVSDEVYSPFADSTQLRETEPEQEDESLDHNHAHDMEFDDLQEPEQEDLFEETDHTAYETDEVEEEAELVQDEASDEELAELFGDISDEVEEEYEPEWEQETYDRLNRKLKAVSLLPHFGVVNNSQAPMSPMIMNPGIYADAVKYSVASGLQGCLKTVMERKEFRHIKVALVDLTKDVSQPEFAGFFHKQQMTVENLSKLGVLYAAFQLRRDLRVALEKKASKTLADLFDKVRDDWAATQLDVKAPVERFAGTISLRRKLVLFKGATVPLVDPRGPRLEKVFEPVPSGDPKVEFSTSGQSEDELQKLSDEFSRNPETVKKQIGELGFRERLWFMMRARHPKATNHAASTIIADLGYLYIASTLIQSGMFDPAREGGLWVASNYAGKSWPKGAGIGGVEGATPASLAAFFSLLMQDRLGDRDASAEMRALLTEPVSLPGEGSPTAKALQKLPNEGSPILVLSRSGNTQPGMHNCAFIERQTATPGKDVVRYVAVGLGSMKSAEWPSLLPHLDRCILLNNSLISSGQTTPELEFDELDAEAAPVEEEIGILGGKDERMAVRDPLAVPFRWVCRIWIQSRVKFGQGHEEKTGLAPLATGVLVTRSHVLTAAHVLHGIKQRGSVAEEHTAYHVEVAPGAHGSAVPFGRVEAESWDIAPKWKPGTSSSQHDYALIKLKKPVGNTTLKQWNNNRPLCYWGSVEGGAGTSVDAAPSAVLKNLLGARVMTAGYPHESSNEMICAAGVFSAGASSQHLSGQGLVEDWVKRTAVYFITADASEGQSGSPVWVLNNGKRYLIGVLVAIGHDYNTVVNVNQAVVQQLRSWIRKG